MGMLPESVQDATEAMLRRFETYDPTDRPPLTAFWPPLVRPLRWNGNRRAVASDAIHYDRAETTALLRRLDALGVGRERVLVSDFYSGLSSLLWSQRFHEVHTISVRPYPERRLMDGRFSIFFGRVGDMPFLHEVAATTIRLDMLLIDGSMRYDLAMILYYTFGRLVSPGGVVVFLDTKPVANPLNGLPRLIGNLRSGDADGIAHRIEDLPPFAGGLGVAYEIVPTSGFLASMNRLSGLRTAPEGSVSR